MPEPPRTRHGLVKLITSGDIYRFLHKPVSPPRVSPVHRSRHTPAHGGPHILRRPRPARRHWRGLMPAIFIGIALLIIGATVAAYIFFKEGPRQQAPAARYPICTTIRSRPRCGPRYPAAASRECAIRRHRRRTTKHRLQPLTNVAGGTSCCGRSSIRRRTSHHRAPGTSALDLYRQVLATHPGDAQAEAGLDRIARSSSSRVPRPRCSKERVDDAARAIEDARCLSGPTACAWPS